MQVTLYEFVKRENSTKRPTTSTPSEVTGCVLKEATSIIRPTLVFTGLGNPTRFNYLYIEELGGRYYFIEDWVSVQNRWECNCTVDVLASFKTEIGGSTEYILRSSYEKDDRVIDTLYPVKNETVTYHTSKGSPFNPGPYGFNSGNYVVGIITGDANAFGSVGYYVFTASQFRQLVDNLFSDNIIEDIENLDLIKAQLNPIQYVVSVKWFPEGIAIDTYDDVVSNLKLGWWSVGTSCKRLRSTVALLEDSIALPQHPQTQEIGRFLNFSPYTKHTIVINPFGSIVLDPSYFDGLSALKYDIDVDIISGVAILSFDVGTATSVKEIMSYKAVVGVDIKLAQVASDYYGAQVSAIGGIASAIGGAVTGVVGGIIGGFSGLASSIGNATQQMMPSVSCVGGSSGVVDCYTPVKLVSQFWKLVQTDNSRLGSPLCKIRTISNIPGYIVVNDADFRASCTAQENVMIKDYMEGGFFYE